MSYDVCVIGAGVMGTSLAHHLAQRGARVAVLDKLSAAGGPSGASAGMLRAHYADPLVAAAASYGCAELADFPGRVGRSSGFVRCGYLAVGDGTRLQAIRAAIDAMQACGHRVEVLDREAVAVLEPRFASSDVVIGAYEPDCGTCEPLFVADGYARSAQAAGAELLLRRRVTAVRPDGDGWAVFCHGGERISAAQVAVCAGGFGNRLVRPLGGAVPIQLVRVQAGRWRPPARFGAPGPILSHHHSGTWWRPDGDDGHYLVGARADWLARGPWRRSTGQAGADLRELDRLAEATERLFPAMAGGIWRGSWSSWLDFTPDGNPVIDLVPDRPGLLLATGLSGHGFKLCPAFGRAGAELLLDGAVTSFDWTPFAWGRFSRRRTAAALGSGGTGTG